MRVPLEIRFHGLSRSDAIETHIRDQANRLERFYDDIISCRVGVEQPQMHQRFGNPYRVVVEVTIPPKKHLVAKSEPADEEQHVPLQTVIKNTFHRMERELKKAVAKKREKQAPVENYARIVRLFSDDGYGFIQTASGEEFYFHRDAVAHNDFEKLEVGTEVSFEPEMGQQGPQAGAVHIIAKPK